jgi:hypothetical protein
MRLQTTLNRTPYYCNSSSQRSVTTTKITPGPILQICRLCRAFSNHLYSSPRKVVFWKTLLWRRTVQWVARSPLETGPSSQRWLSQLSSLTNNHQNLTRQEWHQKEMPLNLFSTKFEAKSTTVMDRILQTTEIERTLSWAESSLLTATWEETITHNLICRRSPSCWRMPSKLTTMVTAKLVRTPGRCLIKTASLIQASTLIWITASVSTTWSKTQEILCLRYMSSKRKWSIKTKY